MKPSNGCLMIMVSSSSHTGWFYFSDIKPSNDLSCLVELMCCFGVYFRREQIYRWGNCSWNLYCWAKLFRSKLCYNICFPCAFRSIKSEILWQLWVTTAPLLACLRCISYDFLKLFKLNCRLLCNRTLVCLTLVPFSFLWCR